MVLVRPPKAWRTMTSSKKTDATTATSDDGTSLPTTGTLGKYSMSAMARMQRSAIQTASQPVTHSCVCSSWNGCSCAMPITIARPFTKPIITGVGTSWIRLLSRKKAKTNMRTDATMTDTKSFSTPSYTYSQSPPPVPSLHERDTNVPATAAIAPVAPLIMPGLPPKTVAKRPTIHAAWRPTDGSTLAMKAKATDSGICAKHMIRPESISVFQ
mmetsp:Transcript_7372/g.18015  ORF Transcript_7372/g.18015 Transcript_7372/m.18015 type:complete len:213 (+) Transcript_7372:2341-2979(+)